MFRRALRRYSTAFIEGLETRWPKLPEAEQAAIAERIYAKEAGDWRNMSLEEKRASYFIAYGPYGARTPRDPAHNYRVAGWTTFFFLVAVGMWKGWYAMMTPKLVVDDPEWQKETDRRAIEKKQNPFQGPYYEHRTKNSSE